MSESVREAIGVLGYTNIEYISLSNDEEKNAGQIRAFEKESYGLEQKDEELAKEQSALMQKYDELRKEESALIKKINEFTDEIVTDIYRKREVL